MGMVADQALKAAQPLVEEAGAAVGRGAGAMAAPALQAAATGMGAGGTAGLASAGGFLGSLFGPAGTAAGTAAGTGLGGAMTAGLTGLAASAPEIGAGLGKAAAMPLAQAAARIPGAAASKMLRGGATALGSYGRPGEDAAAESKLWGSTLPRFNGGDVNKAIGSMQGSPKIADKFTDSEAGSTAFKDIPQFESPPSKAQHVDPRWAREERMAQARPGPATSKPASWRAPSTLR